MSEQKHTPEPWGVFDRNRTTAILDSNENEVVGWMGFDLSEIPRKRHSANARRIVRCVNYCKGITNERIASDMSQGVNAKDQIEAYDELRGRIEQLDSQLAEAQKQNDRMEAALQKLEQWSRAYPIKVFPEPDFKKVHELLSEGGLSLDAVSASNMRHVVEGVGKIARAALANEAKQEKV